MIIGFLAVALPGITQSRRDLEEKRKRLLQNIERTSKQLVATQSNKEKTLQRYLTLQQQIRQRQQLLNTIREEMIFTEASIARTNDVLNSLQADVTRLQKEYTQMLRVALRHRLNHSYLFFLLSADNLNEAFRRWQYLRQYERYRRRQAHLIRETQRTLADKSVQLEARLAEKANLLGVTELQKTKLSTELTDKDNLLQSLKTDERKLASTLSSQEEAARQLNSVIENIIRQEMEAVRRRARTSEIIPTKDGATATNAASGNSFQEQKGRLPWPVASGQIVRGYGTQAHPTLKSVRITNNGIDIRTTQGAPVKAIFAGKVAGTQFIPGYQNTVILQHGTYYSVYSNLATLRVKRGDSVSAEQVIGELGQEKPEVHFEVWREKQRLNPAEWVQQ
ncbi:MAG: peptidoglycan DD-metalloendopeptidase family protein [Lewinellaceae bacterium]|nr:peptidoglycan DD-metalloendopeptidase family protein [Lewinellaceae bacterium]